MFRIVTKKTVLGNVVPYGVRNDDGFVCMFNLPTHYQGQDERYARECEELRARAQVMCAALAEANIERKCATAKVERAKELYTRQRIKQLENRAAGLCERCSSPSLSIGSRLCEKHRAIETSRHKERYVSRGGNHRCRLCGESGHNKRLCPAALNASAYKEKTL